MSTSKEIRTLRYMAVERAIGEMQSILHTFWSTNDEIDQEWYEQAKKNINQAITLLQDLN